MLASTALGLATVLVAAGSARAQDATWRTNPPRNIYDYGADWSTGNVPTGTAYFGTSAVTALTFQSSTSVGGWTFNAGASNYSFVNDTSLQLTFNGAGIVIIGGSASITNRGNLQFFNTGTAGSATIANDGGQLFFNDNSTAGGASIANTGIGIVHFNNASTAGSATITNDNVLYFHNISTAGNATITNNGGIAFDYFTTAGSATITNNGSISFHDSSTAGNAAITNNGGIVFDYSSTASYATINTNGSVLFTDTSTGGSAVLTNSGTVRFDATSTPGNAQLINSGPSAVITFNSTGPNGDGRLTAGSIAGSGRFDLGGAELTVGGNNLSTMVTGVLSGDGSATGTSLIKTGTGTLTLAGANTVSGGVTLASGTLALANNQALGTAVLTTLGGTVAYRDGLNIGNMVTIRGDTSFDVASGTATQSGVIGGSFGLNKTGTGTLALTGTSSYTGATVVNGGTLSVNGSIASSSGLSINSGATLVGTGAVPTTIVAGGGTLAPGNSIGTLTVNGNLTFGAGSTYAVEVSPTAADLTNVTGTASLTGATVQVTPLPGSFRSRSFTILNATGGLGGTTFAGLTGVNSFGSGVRNPHLTYDANNVYLVLDPATLQIPAGLGANQTNVASAINRVVGSGGSPPAGFDVLLNIGAAQLPNALNQISGQAGATTTQVGFNATNQFMAALDPSGNTGAGHSSSGGPSLSYAAPTPQDPKLRDAYAAVRGFDKPSDAFAARWSVWASGYGGSSTTSGSGTSTTSSTAGTLIGADYRMSPDTRLGFALGGANYSFALSGGLGGGRADVFQAGVYGRHSFGAGYLSGVLAYGWQDVTSDRNLTVVGLDHLTANFKANAVNARGEAGWRFTPWPAIGFGVFPYAALQVTSLMLPSYGERASAGSSLFALSYASQTTTNLRSEVGARVEHAVWLSETLLTLRGRLAWAHDSNTDRPVTATFQSLPGASFVVNGTRPAADSALVSAGIETKWLSGFSVAGTFEGEFSDTTRSYAGKGTLRYAW